jgi:hypothetical protein
MPVSGICARCLTPRLGPSPARQAIPERLREWLAVEFAGMPAMSSSSSGMRYKTLVTLLQQNWTVEDKEPPSDSTIRRQLQVMVDSGEIILLERNKKHGDLYRLKEAQEETEEVAEPVEPGETT